jgi:hypothetical protein
MVPRSLWFFGNRVRLSAYGLVTVLVIVGSALLNGQLLARETNDGWVWWPGVKILTHPDLKTQTSSQYVIAGKEWEVTRVWLEDLDKWHNFLHHPHWDQLNEVWMYEQGEYAAPLAKDTELSSWSETRTCCGDEEYTYYRFKADNLKTYFTWPAEEEDFNPKTINIRFRGIDAGADPDPIPTPPPPDPGDPTPTPYIIETDDPFIPGHPDDEGELAESDQTKVIMKPVQVHIYTDLP